MCSKDLSSPWVRWVWGCWVWGCRALWCRPRRRPWGRQTPGGSLVASDITVSGRSWDLYASSGNGYIAFVPGNGRAYPAGTLDLTAFFDYLIKNGQVASTSTLSQIDYGIEVVSTGGGTVRYNVTNFWVHPTHPAIEG
jgi:hypothetical protein